MARTLRLNILVLPVPQMPVNQQLYPENVKNWANKALVSTAAEAVAAEAVVTLASTVIVQVTLLDLSAVPAVTLSLNALKTPKSQPTYCGVTTIIMESKTPEKVPNLSPENAKR